MVSSGAVPLGPAKLKSCLFWSGLSPLPAEASGPQRRHIWGRAPLQRCEGNEAQKWVSDVPCLGQDLPVVFVRTQNVRRESEWVLLSVQRGIRARDLLTLSAGQFGQEPAALQPQRRGHLVASVSELLVS